MQHQQLPRNLVHAVRQLVHSSAKLVQGFLHLEASYRRQAISSKLSAASYQRQAVDNSGPGRASFAPFVVLIAYQPKAWRLPCLWLLCHQWLHSTSAVPCPSARRSAKPTGLFPHVTSWHCFHDAECCRPPLETLFVVARLGSGCSKDHPLLAPSPPAPPHQPLPASQLPAQFHHACIIVSCTCGHCTFRPAADPPQTSPPGASASQHLSLTA